MDSLDPAIEALADDFITAVEKGDVDAIAQRIFAPNVVIWHNFDNTEKRSEQSYALMRWLASTLPEVSYDDIVREPIAGGYVERHTVRGTGPGGEKINVPACFFVTVADRRITRIDEYLDVQAIEALSQYGLPL